MHVNYTDFKSKVKTQDLPYPLGKQLPKLSIIVKLVFSTFLSIALLN